MSAATEARRPAWIRSAVDFGALAAFVAAFGFLRVVRKVESDEALIQATWVLMAGSAIALAAGWLVERRLAWLPAITGAFALVFGAMTVFFHDPEIIKIKLTVQNGLLAAILLGSLAFGRLPAKAILGEAIRLPDAAWRTLTFRYGLYFVFCAVANEVVRRAFSDDFWVFPFRPALLVGALLFAIAQAPFIMKHMQTEEAPTPEPPDTGL